MKKVFLTLILTIGAVLIFTSCTKKQKIKTDRFDDQTINMSYQALSSIKMLETKEEYTTVKRLSNRVANQEVVEKEVIDKYLGLMQELLNDNGGFKTETKVSDKPEYSNLVEITTRNFQNQTVVYSLYYNEISSEIKTEIDEDDLTEEIETEKRISGIAIVGEKEFILEGIVKEEKENAKIEETKKDSFSNRMTTKKFMPTLVKGNKFDKIIFQDMNNQDVEYILHPRADQDILKYGVGTIIEVESAKVEENMNILCKYKIIQIINPDGTVTEFNDEELKKAV